MRKDFKDVVLFIIVAFIVPPVAISTGNIYGEVFGYVAIATAFLFVYTLDKKMALERAFASNQAKIAALDEKVV